MKLHQLFESDLDDMENDFSAASHHLVVAVRDRDYNAIKDALKDVLPVFHYEYVPGLKPEGNGWVTYISRTNLWKKGDKFYDETHLKDFSRDPDAHVRDEYKQELKSQLDDAGKNLLKLQAYMNKTLHEFGVFKAYFGHCTFHYK